jgi:hypothetical protein
VIELRTDDGEQGRRKGGGANGAAALGADHRGAQFADVLHTQNGGGQGRI